MKKNILIIDDSRFMQRLIKSIVIQINQIDKIFVTDNQKEIFNIIHRNKIDIIIMDIIMEGFTGIAILKILNKTHPHIKVIMCSSMGQKNYINQAINYGAVDFIIKPFLEKDLKTRITNVLNTIK